MSDKKNTKKSVAKKSAPKDEPAVPTKIDHSKLKKDTRLVSFEEFDWDRVVYGHPQTKTHPEGTYKMITVQYMYDDETIGPLILPLGKHYCFGVQPDNTDNEGNVRVDKAGNPKALTGYKTPIVMTSQRPDKPDPEDWEAAEVAFFDSWKDELVRYALENKKLIGLGGKKDATIEDMVSDILYRQKNKDTGEFVEGYVPKLYANLIYYPKTDKKAAHVGTSFYGPGDKSMNISELKNHFNIHANVRIDYVTVTKTIGAKVRLYDATVEPVNRAPPKRLAATNTMDASEADFSTPPGEEGEEDGEEELMASETEYEEEVEYVEE